MKMSVYSRLSVAVAAMLLAAVFYFPLWRIGLIAPQYPEGLTLQIWINKITGDVRTINVLNHYIGMAKVEPNNIPELRWFPYFFGFFSLSGMLAAMLGRRRFLQLWCLGLLLFALSGLYDFYCWEYRYGHEISDDAPMKLEESYQPPLIGTKQILTITASSWPELGGYAFSLSAILALLIGIVSLRRNAGS